MSSKLQLVSVLVLAAVLAGCGSTKTGSIDPGGNGGNNGGQNGGGDNGGGDNGTPGNQTRTYEFRNGKFLSYGKNNTDTPDNYTGTMEAKVADDKAEMEIPTSAMGYPINKTNMANIGGQKYGTTDDFLDLGQSGDNYTVGAVFTQDAASRYLGVAVDGNVTTTQHTADAEYKGEMHGAAVPRGWTPEPGEEYVSPYRLTGDAELSLKVFPASDAQISGTITNVKIDDVMDVPGQINLLSSAVTNGSYSGSVTHNLAGQNGGGSYDGAFYGDDAAETAGTLSFSGQIPGGVIPDVAGSTSYDAIAGFGAKKQP